MEKILFILREAPATDRPVSFMENYRVTNQRRMLRNATQHIENLIILRRYAEAEIECGKLKSIIGIFGSDMVAEQDAAMKRSNPPAPVLSKALKAVR